MTTRILMIAIAVVLLFGLRKLDSPETQTNQRFPLTSSKSDSITADTANLTNPQITVNTEYYPIQGETAEALREQMSQLGPPDQSSSRRFDAYTKWHINYHYYYQRSGDFCQLRDITIQTNVTMTLPKWDMSGNPSSDLINRWNQYMAALINHENGHKDHAVNASRELLDTLSHLGGASDCNQLGQIANQTGDRIIQKYAQEDVTYDQQTNHGATQGAIFP